MNETVRNHPVIVATTAATGGVLLGAFVMFQLFAAPQPPRLDGTAQAAVETSVAPKAQVETTGVAAGDVGKVASSDCDQQTWPYLSRACIEETRAKNGSPRVVSTDKIDKPAVAVAETAQPEVKNDGALTAPAPWSSTVASTTPPVVAPAIATVGAPKQAPDAAPAEVAVATPPEPPAATPPEPAAAASETARTNSKPATQAAVKEAAASEPQGQRPAKKAKRKPKPERALAERDAEGDDEMSAAAVEREDRAARRVDRRRIERWTERDYDVAEEGGGGRRRVIVIRRGGGMFENLFGMGRGEYD